MDEHYQYTIIIKFRNGKVLNINTSDMVLKKDSGSYKPRIWFDGKPQMIILSGVPNVFHESEFYLYNAAPVKANLFEYFPEDWDKEDEQFNVIDQIFVNSRGIIRHG